MRVITFVEQKFYRVGLKISTPEPFLNFLGPICRGDDQMIVLGAVSRSDTPSIYEIPENSSFWSLPYYPNLIWLLVLFPIYQLLVIMALIGKRTMWDCAIIAGPHPIAIAIASVCKMLKKPFVLVVRENLPVMVRHRYEGSRLRVGVCVALALEKVFAYLGKETVILCVGDEIRDRYRCIGVNAISIVVSLVTELDLLREGAIERKPCMPVRLLGVGRLAPEKGFANLITAVAILKTRGISVVLRIVGEGSDRRSLEKLAESLGVRDLVCLVGYVQNGPWLWPYYRESDLLIVPSLTEGVPQVIIEGMATGIPVVATRVGGIPGIVRDHISGLLVPPGSSQALADAITELCRDQNLYDVLSQSSFKLAQTLTQESQLKLIRTCLCSDETMPSNN